jgi:hypothetical protein
LDGPPGCAGYDRREFVQERLDATAPDALYSGKSLISLACYSLILAIRLRMQRFLPYSAGLQVKPAFHSRASGSVYTALLAFARLEILVFSSGG